MVSYEYSLCRDCSFAVYDTDVEDIIIINILFAAESVVVCSIG